MSTLQTHKPLNNSPTLARTFRPDFSLFGLFGLLIIALVNRYIDPAQLLDIPNWPDSAEYAMSARSISESGRFAIAINGLELPTRYSLGYPLLIALVYKLFGPAYPQAIYVTLGLDLLQIVLVYVIARKLFGRWAGLLAAALIVVSQPDVFLAKQILSDLPNTTILLIGLLTLLLYAEKPQNWRLAIIAGGFYGLACLVRQTNLIFLPFLLLWVVVGSRGLRPGAGVGEGSSAFRLPPSALKFLLAPACFLISLAAFIGPVLLFNKQTFGGFLRTGYNLWLPAWHDNLSKTFNLEYAFGADGRVGDYLPTLLGLPGPSYHGEQLALYLPPVAALAVLACAINWWRDFKQKTFSLQSRFGLLALGLIIASLILYSLYWYKADLRFVHLWLPLVAILASGGVVICLDWLGSGFGVRDSAPRKLSSTETRPRFSIFDFRFSIKNFRLPSSVALITLVLLIIWGLVNAIGQGWDWNQQYQAEKYEYIRIIEQYTPPDAVIVTDDIQPIFFSAYQQYSGQRRMMSLTQTRHVMPQNYRFPTIKEQPGLVAELIRQGRPVYYLYSAQAAGEFEKLPQTSAYRLEEINQANSRAEPNSRLILSRILMR